MGLQYNVVAMVTGELEERHPLTISDDSFNDLQKELLASLLTYGKGWELVGCFGLSDVQVNVVHNLIDEIYAVSDISEKIKHALRSAEVSQQAMAGFLSVMTGHRDAIEASKAGIHKLFTRVPEAGQKHLTDLRDKVKELCQIPTLPEWMTKKRDDQVLVDIDELRAFTVACIEHSTHPEIRARAWQMRQSYCGGDTNG